MSTGLRCRAHVNGGMKLHLFNGLACDGGGVIFHSRPTVRCTCRGDRNAHCNRFCKCVTRNCFRDRRRVGGDPERVHRLTPNSVGCGSLGSSNIVSTGSRYCLNGS